MNQLNCYPTPEAVVARVQEDDTDQVVGFASSDTGTTERAISGAEPTRDFDHRVLFSRVKMALFERARTLRIGKYEVERHLGAGGMGQVYLCRDESLGRKVAVKRVRGLASETAQIRLHREAVALAQLSHDNVVQVYESGEHEGQIFLVMEYVEGQTLSSWMRGSHTRAQILGLFLAAGRGLAAAHAAGLVHRDFKPDNVLIDGHGKPKVADFGLVSWGSQAREGQPPSASGSPIDTQLTSAEGIIGTRKYMPLEQILGAETGPRSDQFSFCLVLYEALWEKPAFSYESFEARIEALREAALEAPSRDRDLFRVIRRGLARDPDERWPDMNTLLVALERTGARRRRAPLIAGAGLTLGAGLLMALSFTSRAAPCSAITDELETVWSPAVASSLAHLGQLDAAHAADSLALVSAGLDRWADTWVDERSTTCRNLHDTSSGARELELAQHRCLARQRDEVGGIVARLRDADADADALGQALIAVTTLPAPASCGTPGVDPIALSPEIATQADLLYETLTQARVMRATGDWEATRVLITRLEPDARRLGYEPLLARVLGERAKFEEEAGLLTRAEALYLEAMQLARAGGATELELELLLERAELSVFELSNLETATERYAWLDTHLAARTPSSGLLARRSIGRGRLHALRGDREAASSEYRAAIEHSTSESADLPAYYTLLAEVAEDPADGLAASQRAHESAANLWGATHPRTAEYMRNHALALERSGEHEASARMRERALKILTSEGAPAARALAAFDHAQRSIEERDWDAAQRHVNELARAQSQFLDPLAPAHGQVEYLRTSIAHKRGNLDAAIAHAWRAVETFEMAPGSGDPQLWTLRNFLANALLSAGDLDGARAQAEAVIEAAMPGSQEACVARLRLAELAVRSADPRAAALELEACERPRLLPPSEKMVLDILRVLVWYRHPQPKGAPPSLAPVGASLSPVYRAWLDELHVTEVELRALGY